MGEKMVCEQCDNKFDAGSHNARYCSKQCKRDFAAKRPKSQSKHWQKTGERWPTVKQAAPKIIKVPKANPAKRKNKISLILPDPQIGYRFVNGKLDPFHDEKALHVARLLAEYLRPDEAIFLGDVLDFATYGKYVQEPGFAGTSQAGIDRTYEELKIHDELAKKVVFIQGNHDLRLRKYIELNAQAAASIRVAGQENGNPVFSLQNLLRFDEMNIEHIDSYPKGYYWINKNLACIHGYKVKAAGVTAAHLANSEIHSTIFGHIHRIEWGYNTKHTSTGPIETVAHSPGTLARVDNAVPGVTSSLTTDGKPATFYQNWQQGISVVYSDGNEFDIQHIRIKNGKAFYDGKVFK